MKINDHSQTIGSHRRDIPSLPSGHHRHPRFPIPACRVNVHELTPIMSDGGKTFPGAVFHRHDGVLPGAYSSFECVGSRVCAVPMAVRSNKIHHFPLAACTRLSSTLSHVYCIATHPRRVGHLRPIDRRAARNNGNDLMKHIIGP